MTKSPLQISQYKHVRIISVLDNIYKMTSVDYTIEDGQLFQLLKRQCLHGVLSGFKYLVDSRVHPKEKEYIFKQRDENGCILLHYAACGGNILILDEILQIASDKVLEYKCARGQNALHFAIKYKQKDMTDHLIKKYSLLSTTISENMYSTDSNTSNHDNNMVEKIAIVHWVAWLGDVRLLASLKQYNFDISLKTRNGLSILDLACMKKETEASEGEFEFCIHLLNNEAKYIDPSKTDVSGWTIAHYASFSNIKLLEYMAANEKFCYLIMKKTNSLKTCLHIACEFAKHEIVKFIAKNFETLLHDEDELGWNALHFAAKGGNLDTLRYLLSRKGMNIDCRTKDGKTLLHIACISKQTSICEFVVSAFSEELLNAKTNKYHLTAAHYLGVEKKEDGSETKIFEILAGSKMKLSAKSSKGLSVLDFAIDHLNKELVQCMVKTKYREKLRLNSTILARCKENTKDDIIKQILQTAIDDI